jgi:hypothetical protein
LNHKVIKGAKTSFQNGWGRQPARGLLAIHRSSSESVAGRVSGRNEEKETLASSLFNPFFILPFVVKFSAFSAVKNSFPFGVHASACWCLLCLLAAKTTFSLCLKSLDLDRRSDDPHEADFAFAIKMELARC